MTIAIGHSNCYRLHFHKISGIIFPDGEKLVSMMSTYVALAIMNYLLRTFLMETKAEYPQTDALAASVWLARIIPGTRLHIGFVLGVLACIGVWILHRR